MGAVAERVAVPMADPPPLRVRKRRWTSFILPAFTGLMITYLASPVALMILYGFNDLQGERQTARFTCCTVRWWREILSNPSLNSALKTSVWIALTAAFVATILGALIGLALGRYSFRGRGGFNFVIFLAIAVPEIVLGSSLLAMFIQISESIPGSKDVLNLGYATIWLSHVGFAVAFVAITVRARVQGLDDALESAAQDLYATPMQAFFKVTLPLITPGIVAGYMLAFVLSLDDFVITNFVGGAKNTFPTWVYGSAKLGVPPHVNVWGTVLFSTGILVAGLQVVRAGRKRAA
ncbi:MAG: ABC transporter permease [Actinomycetota bacterium]